jgi:hypothetical protein
MKIENAIIKNTFLGIQDHGIFTYTIGLETNIGYFNFGCRALDGKPPPEFKGPLQGHNRVCSGFAGESIKRVLKVLEIDKWEALPESKCRIQITEDYHAIAMSNGFIVRAIGHYLYDEWFHPEELAKDFGGEKQC